MLLIEFSAAVAAALEAGIAILARLTLAASQNLCFIPTAGFLRAFGGT